MIKYYPYKSDTPNKKYYIITNDNKKVYFGAAGYEHFSSDHKDEERKLRYIKDIIMKTGLNPELIAQGSGRVGCYGIYQQ